MLFQIKEIVVWPKNLNFKPRRLPLALGALNIISGTSRTGKSAIIPIIDYCLGSDKCTIPVNTIRDACSWFGIVVHTASGEKLFARREPGQQKATGDMFVLEASEIQVPDIVEEKNTSAEAVKRTLDELAGLTALDFDVEGSDAFFKGRPSFRDLGAFIFQPQNIVANPDVLFYKADTYEHREKLRTIFPYVLHAISPATLAKQHELSRLRKELRRKQHELNTVRDVSERWIAEIQSRVSEARELGLIATVNVDQLTREQLVDLLSEVVHGSTSEATVTEETINEAIRELLQLQREEEDVSLGVSRLRRRLAEMSTLKSGSEAYHGALEIQQDRLRISTWLRKHEHTRDCPICGNSLNSTDHLDQLYESLIEIEKTAGDLKTIPASFDRELERVQQELQSTLEKLRGIRIRRQALERTSEDAKQRQYDSLKVSRFIGNLEQSLQTYARIGFDSELDQEVADLQERVNSLEKDIAEEEIRARTTRALRAVSANAEKLMPSLDAERPNDPLGLSIQDLTVKVQGIDREDYLWEIGSGSNWLSYHIAISLGLHQFFLALKETPVPSFIVYDQPSQVYFPVKSARRAESEREITESIEPEFTDEDIIAIRKVYSVLADVVRSCNSRLQVIVLDHASDDVWGSINGAHLVEQWRHGNKLIPIEWLT
jgi:hypothetical protein